MASIRRTLSPVTRPGMLMNGEANLVASPLSRSTSSNQNHTLPNSSSSGYGFYTVQSFISDFFSHKSSRPLEKTKLKGHVWRRAIFQFLVCFFLGIFVGLTPFVSLDMSPSYTPEGPEFPLKKFSPFMANEKMVVDELPTKSENVSLKLHLTVEDNSNVTSDASIAPQSFGEALNKLLIIVTPTYARPFEAYYLNRLAHTLKSIPPPVLWIVVEMNSQSVETADLLRKTGVMYRHLACVKNLTEIKYRSLHQRNLALSHIEMHRLDGIVFFADDTNIYATELFEQMRLIRRLGTWAVAKLVPGTSQIALEGPVCNGGHVLGWHSRDGRRRSRRFHVGMSGFAFNSTILWDSKKWHRPNPKPIRQLDTVKEEVQVSTFVEQIVEDESQMEGLPQNCSKVMVWHLQIKSPSLYSYPPHWLLKNNLNVVHPLNSQF
ncbi:hypothetical protein ACET3Z_004288 [Daucus carota]